MITIAFTRPERRLNESIAAAEEMGFRVLAAPSLEIIPGKQEDFRNVKEELSRGRADICIFSSSAAAEECINAWGNETAKILEPFETIPIGPGTAEFLKKNGIRVDGVPQTYSSQGLVDHLSDRSKGKRIMIIHSDKGSEVLRKGLESNGAHVAELIAYRLEKVNVSKPLITMMEEIVNGNVDVLAFTSPLSAESFFETAVSEGYAKNRIANNTKIAAIGKPTADMLRSMGLKVSIVPEDSTFRSLLETIRNREIKE